MTNVIVEVKMYYVQANKYVFSIVVLIKPIKWTFYKFSIYIDGYIFFSVTEQARLLQFKLLPTAFLFEKAEEVILYLGFNCAVASMMWHLPIFPANTHYWQLPLMGIYFC